jgi:hypothetical protein
MRTFGKVCAALLLCAALSACPLFPRKADLDAVHDAYRADFKQSFPASATDDHTCRYSTAFDSSLEAIRGFQAKWRGENSAEMGHVTVLKGMIHLQAGHFGLARDMIATVKAAPIAASDDRRTRDVLFKDAYEHLVDGWQAACESIKAPTVVEDGKFSVPPGKQRSTVLTDAAAAILKQTKSSLPHAARPGAEADDGAIYLATAASIFQYYVLRMRTDKCRLAADAQRCIQEQTKPLAAPLAEGLSAIHELLTPDEKKAVYAQSACPKAGSVSDDWKKAPTRTRQRYVDWYLQVEKAVPCAGQPKPVPE